MIEEPQKRVLELAALLCDELITAEQFAELDELLASDRDAREAYRGFLALHQRLEDGALEADDAAAAGEAVLDPAHNGATLEIRVRRAERRAMWSMAACFVVTLFLIILLVRPRLEQRAVRSWYDEDSARKSSAIDREPGDKTVNAPRGEFLERNKGLVAILPPVTETETARVGGGGAGTDGLEPALIAEHSSGPSSKRGLPAERSIEFEGHMNYVAKDSNAPATPVAGPVEAPAAPDTVLSLGSRIAVPTGRPARLSVRGERANKAVAENPIVPEDSPLPKPAGNVDYAFATPKKAEGSDERAANIDADLENGRNHWSIQPQPKSAPTLAGTTVDHESYFESAETEVRKRGGEARQGLKKRDQSAQGDPSLPAGSLTVHPTSTPPATTSLGQQADGYSWGDVPIAGGVFASKAATDGRIALDRLASRKGAALSGGSTIGGVAHDSFTGDLPTREDYEAANSEFFPLSNSSDSALILPTNSPQGEASAGAPGRETGWRFEYARPEAKGETALDDDARRALIDGGQVAGDGQAQGRPAPTTRAPIVIRTAKEIEPNNQVTEEVRYLVDMKDPVGDPATTREMGVTVAVTPTLLPDGTIRMKMRPRSAQIAKEIMGPSGNRYARVSESMRESIAQIPAGHSIVVGGFYGQVKPEDSNQTPQLGDTPAINFYFKSKEAANEESSLVFVVTPTSYKSESGGKDQVVIDTKILSVNGSAAERAGVDWSSSLGASGVPLETIGSLNSLFGIESIGKGARGTDPAAGDGPIVLSPAQVDGVLRSLQKGGLVTQTSNPTLITEDNEQATISLIDRVPIITTTLEESEVSKKAKEKRERELELQRELRALSDLEKNARTEPYSTFSLNVSDVSFKLAKAALARGEWPAPDQVRVEEFVNAFDYGDPAPSQKEKVACNIEQAAHPFLQQRNLLRVSMRTAALGRSADTPLRLTVLLDNSGSMERADREESVKNALRLLASQLNPQDQVTLIGFARTPRLLADRLAGNRIAELAKVVESTPSEGGTNLEQALELGIAKAKEQMLEGGQNRIILLTDGAANLGNAKPTDLARLVENMRQQGIAFDACGVGAEGLNDDILESLTRKGDGRYYFLDRPEDADEGFARQIAGALRPAARNVKIQMKFNPKRVGRYKLSGFEKHRLKKEDFRNDSVDAAELAAEEAGNAIYQIEVLPEGSGEIGTVSVRFQDTESGRMIEREWTIPYDAQVPRLEDSAASLRLAAGAALLGEKLKGSLIGESVEMARLGKLMNGLTGDFPAAERVKELVQMANKIRELRGE